MTKREGLEYLKRVIEDNIRHKDYDHVTDLADRYRRFYTGEGLDIFIEEMFKIKVPELQINSIIPPILKSTQYPFNKVFRVKPRMRKIDFDGDKVEDRVIALEEKIKAYWAGKPMEDYLQHVVIEYGYLDPNAWVITEFGVFDPKKETASPYPFLALSSEAIDFEMNNGRAEYLIILQNGNRFTMYLENDTIVAQEAEVGVKIGNRRYQIEFYEPKGGRVPAFRIGYIDDVATRGRTFVSIFDKVIPFLKKTLKIDYEGDMSMGDLAFPKRYEYVDDCKHPGCKGGNLPDGEICPACKGTGQTSTHRTATDIREFTLPWDKDEIIDLRQMTFTDFPPVEGLRFQQEYKDKLKNQVFSFMFNAEIFDKTEVSATATEKVIQMDNLNDAVYPLAKHYERIWAQLVEQIAVFTDNAKGLIVQLSLPQDFKFKSLVELMEELKVAREAKASIPTIAAIEDDINEMLYADRPEEMKKIRIKNALNPFMGYTEEMVRVIIAQGLTTKVNQVLYSNLEAIIAELELEHLDPWLYDLNIEKINMLVREKAEAMVKVLADEKPEPVERFNPYTN